MGTYMTLSHVLSKEMKFPLYTINTLIYQTTINENTITLAITTHKLPNY